MGAIYLYYITGLTHDETVSWSLILARAMGHLNGRRLVGVRRLKRAKRKCEGPQVGYIDLGSSMGPLYCDRRAAVALELEYRGKRYSVYLCNECYKRTLEHVNKTLKEKIDTITARLEETVRQATTKQG